MISWWIATQTVRSDRIREKNSFLFRCSHMESLNSRTYMYILIHNERTLEARLNWTRPNPSRVPSHSIPCHKFMPTYTYPRSRHPGYRDASEYYAHKRRGHVHQPLPPLLVRSWTIYRTQLSKWARVALAIDILCYMCIDLQRALQLHVIRTLSLMHSCSLISFLPLTRPQDLSSPRSIARLLWCHLFTPASSLLLSRAFYPLVRTSLHTFLQSFFSSRLPLSGYFIFHLLTDGVSVATLCKLNCLNGTCFFAIRDI